MTQLVERVRAEAASLTPAKALLTVAAALPFVVGWVAGTVVRVSWAALVYAWSAGVVGFRSGRR